MLRPQSDRLAWDQVLKLAQGIWGLANDRLDGPADPAIVKDDAAAIIAIAQEQGGMDERPVEPYPSRPRPFPDA